MRISVQLTPEASLRLRHARRGASARRGSAHRTVLPWLAHAVEPVHPSTPDPTLQRFYAIEVTDPDEASRVLQRLLHDPAVEAAYIKPADDLK